MKSFYEVKITSSYSLFLKGASRVIMAIKIMVLQPK